MRTLGPTTARTRRCRIAHLLTAVWRGDEGHGVLRVTRRDLWAVSEGVRDGELQISTPPLELGPGDDETDAAALHVELDAAAIANEARTAMRVDRTE